MLPLDPDIDEIRRALDLFLAHDRAVELRIPGTHRGTVSGYYSDREALARDAAQWGGKAPGVYITPNPVLPDLLARSFNTATEYARYTTQDEHILTRRWFLIDFDAERPAGISASDEEHALALQKAQECRAWLYASGWPGVVLADSGNGGHLLARIDLANDEASRILLERCLAGLKSYFGDARVSVDQKVANASRIWKLYGTPACKGFAIPGRPHRLARLLDVPELLTVSPELLAGLAQLAPVDPPRPRPTRTVSTPAAAPSGRGDYSTLDAVRWFQDHGAYRESAKELGKHWVECPWSAEHTMHSKGETVLWEADGGWPTFHCSHDHCHGRDIRTVMELWGDADSYCAQQFSTPAAWPTIIRPEGQEQATADRIPDHARRSALLEHAGALRRQAFELDEIADMLWVVNTRRCDPPLDQAEVRAIAEQVCRFEPTEAASWRVLADETAFTGIDPLRKIKSDPPVYTATVRGRTVQLGLLELREFKRFQNACLQQVNYLPQLPTPDSRGEKLSEQKRWDIEFVAPAVERMERLEMIEDAPDDAGERGAAWQDVLTFFTAKRRFETREDVYENKLVSLDGFFIFKGLVLRKWLAENKLNRLKADDLWNVVRERGDGKPFNLRTSKGQVHCWKVPCSVIQVGEPSDET